MIPEILRPVGAVEASSCHSEPRSGEESPAAWRRGSFGRKIAPSGWHDSRFNKRLSAVLCLCGPASKCRRIV